MSTATDLELLTAWRNGDTVAADELLERHFVSVYRFFRRKLPTAELARELSQRTLVSCVESLERLRESSRFRAFLFGIARNHLLRYIRDEGRKNLGVADPTPSQLGPSAAVAMAQEERLLLEALHTLPLDLQLTIELHYWEGMKMAEIGDVLEVAAGTVKWRLSKARDELREAITRLAATPQLRDSTLHGLDTWARGLRSQLDAD